MNSLKKILLSVTVCLLGLSMYAQETVTVLNYDFIKKRLEKSDEAIENPKKNVQSKTWFQRGTILQDAADIGIDQVQIGQTPLEVGIAYGTPQKVEKNPDTGVEIQFYPDAKVFFENGKVSGWEQTSIVTEEPLRKALDAYDKAIELDVDGKINKKLLPNLQRIKTQLQLRGIMAYEKDNYEEAYNYFKQYTRAGEFEIFEGAIDTAIYYYAAFNARKAGLYDDAVEFYKKVIEYNYGGQDPYVELKEILLEHGDSAQALEILQYGFNTLEDNSTIVKDLVYFYIVSNRGEEALKYLEIALQTEPDNESYHFAEGVLRDQLGETEKAIESYLKAVEIDPEFFDAYYNLAIIHYNQGVELFGEADKTKDNKKYNELKKQAEAKLKESLPYMEKAYAINPEDLGAVETLKNLYYRDRENYQEKYDEMNAKYKELKAKQ